LALAKCFTSKADKLKAGQTREGIQKTELPNGLGCPFLLANLSRDKLSDWLMIIS